MENIVSDRVNLSTSMGAYWRDSRRVNRQEPWRCLVTFQDKETYDWYTERCISKGNALIMDPSELPGRAEQVKFWSAYGTSIQLEYYAIGKVTIGGGV